jgi:hypothetical protein
VKANLTLVLVAAGITPQLAHHQMMKKTFKLKTTFYKALHNFGAHTEPERFKVDPNHHTLGPNT